MTVEPIETGATKAVESTHSDRIWIER
jgi:hypothetical protein